MIRTPRLILRPYREADRAAFVALNTDADVRRHMDGALTTERAAALFDRMLAGGTGLHALAVVDRERHEFLGHVFVQHAADAPEAELGFVLVRAAWGQGYATEAARALADDALAGEHPPRLVATVDLDHPASARVLEKAGFTFLEQRTDDDGPYAVYAREA